MVLNINGSPHIINEFSDREIIWIFEMRLDRSVRADSVEQKRTIVREHMHHSEANYKNIIKLRLESESYLLPDGELKWIGKNDIRLLRWILHYCSKPSIDFGPPTQIPMSGLNGITESELYDYFIHALDNWQINIQLKRASLAKIRSTWAARLLKDKKLKWLHKDDDSQIKWAWTYMNEYLKKDQPFFQNRYSPITREETYHAILSTFDTWNGETDLIYDLQTSMKQAWAQQKYRTALENKNKKQSTYVLSNETKLQLKALAKADNVNLNQMLEYIINAAHKDFKMGKPRNYADKDDD